MSIEFKLRRGTTAQHSTFTGAEGEVTVDTTKDTLVVHDGVTPGGTPLLKENNPSYTGTLTGGTGVVNLGSGQFYKDASGNVGVGTTSFDGNWAPKFQVVSGANDGTGGIMIESYRPSLIFKDDSASAVRQHIVADSSALLFGSGDASFTERMRIDSGGNVLMGTSSQYGTAKLSVNGSINVPDDLFVGAGVGAGAAASIQFKSGASGFISFLANGNGRAQINANGQRQSTIIGGGGGMWDAFDCRAWVKFNGTGTPSVLGGGNVSSITDSGVGLYSVNFTNAMPDVNYGYTLSAYDTGAVTFGGYADSLSTSAIRVRCKSGSGTAYDYSNISVQIFR